MGDFVYTLSSISRKLIYDGEFSTPCITYMNILQVSADWIHALAQLLAERSLFSIKIFKGNRGRDEQRPCSISLFALVSSYIQHTYGLSALWCNTKVKKMQMSFNYLVIYYYYVCCVMCVCVTRVVVCAANIYYDDTFMVLFTIVRAKCSDLK